VLQIEIPPSPPPSPLLPNVEIKRNEDVITKKNKNQERTKKRRQHQKNFFLFSRFVVVLILEDLVLFTN